MSNRRIHLPVSYYPDSLADYVQGPYYVQDYTQPPPRQPFERFPRSVIGNGNSDDSMQPTTHEHETKDFAVVPESGETGVKKMKRLLKKLSKLQESGIQTDFVIKVGDEEFKVHKCVLAMHSSVFEAMFNTECEESRTNQLKVTRFEAAAVKDFIHFLYNGVIRSIENAVDLFELADKYDIEDLKSDAKEIILENINDSNAFEVFNLSYLHSAEDLKLKAFGEIQKMFPGKPLIGLLNDPEKIGELVRAKKEFDAVLSGLDK